MTNMNRPVPPCTRPHAAAHQHAARRHADPRCLAAATPSARCRWKTPTGSWTGCTPLPASWAPACWCRAEPLRHRPEPAARPTADVRRAEQHRALPHAALHRRGHLPAEARRPTKPRSSAASRPTGSPTTRPCAANWPASARSTARGAVRRAQHQERTALAVRRHAAAHEPGHRRRHQLRSHLRQALAAVLAGQAATAMSSTAASRAATSRATTAGRAMACTPCSWRCAGAPTWTKRRRYRWHAARAAEVTPLLRAWCRRCATGGRHDEPSPLLWAPRAWLPAGWRERCCCKPMPMATGGPGHTRRTTPRRCATVLPGPVLPGLVDAHSHAFQRAFAGLAERLVGAQTTSGPGATACTAWRCASRPTQLRAVATSCMANCCKAATPRSASSTTCTTRPTAALCRPAGHEPGRWRRGARCRHRPDAAAGAVRTRRLHPAGAARRPAPLRAPGWTTCWRCATACAQVAPAAAPERRRGHPLAARRGAGSMRALARRRCRATRPDPHPRRRADR
jgi:hypothetical protein